MSEEYKIKKRITHHASRITHYALRITVFLLFTISASAEELNLQQLIDEALENNHEIMVAQSRLSSSKFRIPQSQSLPDPMFMAGYQNEGTKNLYTFSTSPDSQWMFSVSQMFPFPGKLNLKEEMALRDAEGIKASLDSLKLNTAARVKELYYDLFAAYKTLDLFKDMSSLLSAVENAALSRYSSGMSSQQEVLTAQTERYMLIEKEEMLKQKIQSIEVMLNSVIGGDPALPPGRPSEPSYSSFDMTVDEVISIAYANSPEIKLKEKMIAAAQTKVNMAKKEFYPDFTVTAGYYLKNRNMPDMWSFTTAVNIPIFYKTKQEPALNEARALLSEAEHELEGIRLMISSAVRDNYSMLKTTESLMELYKNGLIPKALHDFEAALAGYVSGKVETSTVISRLKFRIEFEIQYWSKFVERQKAIARLEAITGIESVGLKK
jgi:outer membrane protein TolC